MFWIEKPVNRHFKLAVLFENLDNAVETVIFLKIVKTVETHGVSTVRGRRQIKMQAFYLARA